MALAANSAPLTTARAESLADEIKALKEQLKQIEPMKARLKQLEDQVAAQARKAKAAATPAPTAPMAVAKPAPAASAAVAKPVPAGPVAATTAVPVVPVAAATPSIPMAAMTVPANQGGLGGLTPVWVSLANGLTVESYDKDFSIRFGGNIQADAGFDTQPLGTALNAEVGIWRARLLVEGKAFKYWLYKFEYDFTRSGLNGIFDAYFAVQHPALAVLPFTTQPITLQVGNIKEPFGLQSMGQFRNDDFIARPSSDILVPYWHVGVAASTYGDDWSAKVGVFSSSLQENSIIPQPITQAPLPLIAQYQGEPTGGVPQLDVTGRITWAPIHTQDSLFHIGASLRYHRPNSSVGSSDSGDSSDARVLSPGSSSYYGNELDILGGPLVGVPGMDLSCGPVPYPQGQFVPRCTSSVLTFGTELSAIYGPFSFQGEYIGSKYTRNADTIAYVQSITSPFDISTQAIANELGGSSLYYDGWYVYGTWFLTGESRASAYNNGDLNGANFGATDINYPVNEGGWGAWELLARYSEINLNSGGIQAGRQDDLTIGLNWYPLRGFRLMWNWTDVVHLTGNFYRPYLDGKNPNIFLMRAQVSW